MKALIYISLFLIMLVSLLANPAPQSIEMADLVLIALPCFLGIVCLAATNHFVINRTESNLFIAIIFYLSYLLLSMLIGLLQGVSLLNVLRSIGPYLNFFPLLFMCLLPTRLVSPWVIGIIFMMIGVMQAGYELFLFFNHPNAMRTTVDILRSRITFQEPRTTLPIALSVAILPMAFFATERVWLKFFFVGLMLLGLVAGAATLTRSIILSILVGTVSFIVLYVLHYSRSPGFSYGVLFKKFLIYAGFFLSVLLIISMIPKISMLENGLIARFYHYSSLHASSDYSNGRIYDEWLPALKTWAHSDWLGLFFGIGAGNTFTVVTGEERTYIHNLSIYSLVYGGFYGLFACLWLYFTLFKTLLIRASETHQMIYLGFAALLISLFSYGQLFAVHKGLAFNAMLYVIMMLALCQPTKQ